MWDALFIHWGPPSDAEAYIQETGRAWWDGKPCTAILYYSRKQLGYYFIESSIKEYCRNSKECRRQTLLEDFDQELAETSQKTSGCSCCDVCTILYKWDYCKYQKYNHFSFKGVV